MQARVILIVPSDLSLAGARSPGLDGVAEVSLLLAWSRGGSPRLSLRSLLPLPSRIDGSGVLRVSPHPCKLTGTQSLASCRKSLDDAALSWGKESALAKIGVPSWIAPNNLALHTANRTKQISRRLLCDNAVSPNACAERRTPRQAPWKPCPPHQKDLEVQAGPRVQRDSAAGGCFC